MAENEFEFEYTDTFGREANYSWVKREKRPMKNTSQLALVRKAKKIFGLNGVRSKTSNYGDTIRIDFDSLCVVIFIY